MCNEAFKGIPAYAWKQPSHNELKKILESEYHPYKIIKSSPCKTSGPRNMKSLSCTW
jgi:hypothetical protein